MTRATIITAPAERPETGISPTIPSVFLGGSIENGAAENWQQRVIAALSPFECIIYNPRRDNWNVNASRDDIWRQILWEQKYLHAASFKLFYFDPATKSPITLMELGQMIERSPEDTIVVCPPDFWRTLNVQVTASLASVPVFSTLEPALRRLESKIFRRNSLT